MTMVNNIALAISGNLSAWLTTAFGVTLSDFGGLWKLTLVTSILKVVPILFVPLVPATVVLPEGPGRGAESAKGRRGSANVSIPMSYLHESFCGRRCSVTAVAWRGARVEPSRCCCQSRIVVNNFEGHFLRETLAVL